jgi:hypothetical protein
MAMYHQHLAFGFVVALESAGKIVYFGTAVIGIVGSDLGTVLGTAVVIEVALPQNLEHWIGRMRTLLNNYSMN